MQWTDIRITVPKAQADTAEAIATGISGGGIYVDGVIPTWRPRWSRSPMWT